MDVRLEIDDLLSRYATALINRVASKARVPALRVALRVHGLC